MSIYPVSGMSERFPTCSFFLYITSSAEITDIAHAMQQSSASAAALKIPIEDLTTSLGVMHQAGIKGSDAGTSIKTMLSALTPNTEKAAKAMDELGIKAFDMANAGSDYSESILDTASREVPKDCSPSLSILIAALWSRSNTKPQLGQS